MPFLHGAGTMFVMQQAWGRRLVFLAIASLGAPLACSSSTDGAASTQSTNSSGGNSVNTSTAGSRAGGTSATSDSRAGTPGSSSAMGGSGGLTSGSGGLGGGTEQSSSTGDRGGDPGQPSSQAGRTGGNTVQGGRASSTATVAGGITTGGSTSDSAGASGGRSTTAGAGGNAGRASSGGIPGTGGMVGGTTSGGSTSTSTGPSDSLCPPGITRTITVAKDGSGQFNSVQAAVNSITSGSTARIRIDIKAGTYTEKLTIASRSNLCLVGASATTTILSYGDSNASTGGTSTSASVHISADDFSAANLTFQNTYGSGSQAVALRVTGDRQQFLNCRFVGYQDTLYTHNGSQYFKNCYVQGNTDYVFGGATAVLQNCEVRNVENGSAVAAPNTDAGKAFGIVFLGGKFTAASGVKSVGLGRPWGAAGFAAYLNVELGSHILAAGFVAMSGNQPQNARFHEYGSTGSGANAGSRSSYQLTAAQAADYTLTKIFGSWTPSYSQ